METINDNEIPDWFTQDYIEQALRQYKKDNNLIVLNLHVQPATGKGENYASIMKRIKVLYRLSKDTKICNDGFIVKLSQTDPYIVSVMNDYQVDVTEMLMYEKVLTKLNQILRQFYNNNKEERLCADTVYVDYKNSCIIFEDLTNSNYIMADRLSGMNLELAKFSLYKLAKMHAAASVLNERQNNSLTKFNRGMFNRHTKALAPFFEAMIGVCARFAGDCPELGNYYKEKLLKLQPFVVEYATRIYDVKNERFNTLTHGDFWINNVMVRYDTNSNGNTQHSSTINDVLLVDFQFCVWGSPSIDLHYFFNTSIEGDLRLHHQEELVQYYHEQLTQTLRELQFSGHIPTLKELWLQLEEDRFYAVTSSLVVQAVMINDKTDDADFNSLVKDDDRGRRFRDLLYTNKVVQENAKILLPQFDRRGLLDVV